MSPYMIMQENIVSSTVEAKLSDGQTTVQRCDNIAQAEQALQQK